MNFPATSIKLNTYITFDFLKFQQTTYTTCDIIIFFNARR